MHMFNMFKAWLELFVQTVPIRILSVRALGRILKLPVIFERVPVKTVDAAKKTQGEHTVARATTGVQGQRSGGGPEGRATGNSGVSSILNTLGELS